MAEALQLAARLARGDERALARAYDLYGGAVYQLALRMATAVKRTPLEEPAPAAAEQPEDKAATSQRREIVRQAIAALAPPQRTALELAYYEGLSHSEIAQRLGEPLGTVKTRIRQAMLSIRRSLVPILSGT